MKYTTILFIVILGLGTLYPVIPAYAAPFNVPYTKTVKVVVDGTIGEGEYSANVVDKDTGMEVYMSHDKVNLYLGMKSPGTGWVAVGFGPLGTGMDGANIIIGYVEDATGILHISDEKGTGFEHRSDVKLGGREDILKAAGRQVEKSTTIEFVIPLDSGDVFDYPLIIGKEQRMIVAFNERTDDFEAYHSARSSLSFVLSEEEALTPTALLATRVFVKFVGNISDRGAFVLVYGLTDADGNPISRAPIEVYVNHSLGVARWDSVYTDDKGEANVEFTINQMSAYNAFVTYGGDGVRYLPSNYTYTFSGYFARYLEHESVPENPFYNWGIWIINRPHDVHKVGMSYGNLLEWVGNAVTSPVRTENSFSNLVLTGVYGAIIIAYSFILFVVLSLFRIWREREKR